MIATWIPYLRWWNTKPFFGWNYIPWYPPKLVCLSTVCPNTIWKSNTVMDNNAQSTTILRSKKTWGSIAKRNKLPESSQPQTLYNYFSRFFPKKYTSIKTNGNLEIWRKHNLQHLGNMFFVWVQQKRPSRNQTWQFKIHDEDGNLNGKIMNINWLVVQ